MSQQLRDAAQAEPSRGGCTAEQAQLAADCEATWAKAQCSAQADASQPGSNGARLQKP